MLSIDSKTADRSRTSKFKVCTSVGSSSFKADKRSSLRPHKIKRAPWEAKNSAAALPIPLVAPVISTVLFIFWCYIL